MVSSDMARAERVSEKEQWRVPQRAVRHLWQDDLGSGKGRISSGSKASQSLAGALNERTSAGTVPC